MSVIHSKKIESNIVIVESKLSKINEMKTAHKVYSSIRTYGIIITMP